MVTDSKSHSTPNTSDCDILIFITIEELLDYFILSSFVCAEATSQVKDVLLGLYGSKNVEASRLGR